MKILIVFILLFISNLALAQTHSQYWVTDSPYNAVCDGVTDDNAAIASAIAAAGINGGTVRFPAGTCLSNSSLVISTSVSAIQLEGISKNSSILKFPNGDGFSFTSINGRVKFSNFQISCKVTNTCIILGSTTNAPQQSIIENIVFAAGGIELNLINAGDLRVNNNDFFFCSFYCIQIAASINPDGGDNWISHNFMLNSGSLAGVGVGVHYLSGGGYKIISNKINGFANDIYIHTNMSTGQGTSALQIQLNSLEGYTGSGILFQQQPSTAGVISNIAITGNEFGGASGSYAIQVQPNPTTWLVNFNVTSNIVRGLNQAGCFYINGANTINVSNNICTDAGVGSLAIYLGSSTSGGYVSTNTISNYTTKITNSSAGGSVTTINNGP